MWCPLLWGILLLGFNLNVEASDPSLALQTLNKYLDQKVNELKLKIHKALETERIRRKRNLEPVPVLPEEKALTEEHLKVKEAIPQTVEASNYKARGWADSYYNGEHLIFLATDANILLFAFNGSTYKPVTSIETDAVYKMKTFNHFGSTWLVALQYNKAFDEHFLQLYLLEDKTLQKKQRITLTGESDIDTVSSKGNHYLAVSTYTRKTTSGKSLHAQTKLYEWRTTQFDLVTSIPTKGAKSVCVWSKEGTLYLAIAQERNDENDYSIGSPVYTYNPRKEAQLTYIQRLPTSGSYRVKTFAVGGSRYIILVESYGFHIFWWAGEQFLSWQQLDKESEEYKYPVDIELLTLPNKEIMIALAFKNYIAFFTEDAAANYVETFKTYIPRSVEIEAVNFMHNKNVYYYLLLTFRKTLHNITSIWKLNFTTYTLPYLPTFDPLINCLVELNGSLTERKIEVQQMEQIEPKIWVKDKIQSVVTPVKVNERTKVKNSTILNMYITTNKIDIPPWTNSLVHNEVLEQQIQLQQTKSNMDNVVWKSHDQNILGYTAFESISVIRNEINGMCHGNSMNNIPLNTLEKQTLKFGLDQTVMGNMKVMNLEADNIHLYGQLNSLEITDLLHLDSNSSLTGNIKFSYLDVADVEVGYNSAINKILPSALVTKSKDQVLSGSKNFKNIAAENIDVVKTTNMKVLSEVAKDAVSITREHSLRGYLTFDSTLHIDGNLITAGLINGVNIVFISSSSMLKSADQVITGKKLFQSSLTTGSVEVDGTINNVNILEVARMKINQEFRKTTTFKNLVHFTEDLNTTLINLKQLSIESVLKNANQELDGLYLLTSSTSIKKDVTMTNKKTVNGIDPSDLGLLGTSGTNAIVVADPTVFQKVVINNLKMASEDSQLQSLTTEVWLKSKPQVTNTPLIFLGSVTLENSTVISVNDYKLDTDFVHASGAKITATKIFKGGLVVENPLVVENKVTVNGFDLSEVAGTAGLLSPISGLKTIASVLVNGNIHTITVNNLVLSRDAMITDKQQVVTGHMKFVEPIIAFDMNAEEVTLSGTLNGVVLEKFKSNAVLMEDSKLSLEKKFDWIAANTIVSNGLIDEVDIVELHNWIVMENTHELNTAYNFTGPLEFKASVTVSFLNGLILDQHIKDVVHNEVLIVIRGPKTLRNVHVDGKVTVMDLINGIDIKNLQRHTFMKTGKNHIEAALTFGDVSVGELTTNMLDNIYLLDLTVDGSNVDGSISFVNDVLIEGDFNTPFLNCDLEKVFENSVYMDGPSVVSGNKTLDFLDVTGKIEILGTINGLYVNNLNYVLDLLYEVKNKNFIFMDGLQAGRLVLADGINMINITLVMKDAAKRTSQVIAGQKTFTSGLTLKDAVMKSISADNINNVNILNLDDMAVTKDKSQEINGEKWLNYVKAELKVSGLLNGLGVKELVTTNGSSTILGSTYLTAPDTILLNLTVEGLIDSVNIEALVVNRISLDSSDVLSNLTFNNIKIGNLAVKRINNIEISAVVSKNKNISILGNMSFNFLTTKTNFNSGLVKGIDINYLNKNLVKYNIENHLTSNTIFLSNLKVKSMRSGLLNSFNIDPRLNSFGRFKNQTQNLVKSFNVNIENHDFQLKALFDAQIDQAYLAHFDLNDELQVGPTQEFMDFPMNKLHRSISDTTPVRKLAVWNSETCNTENCCRNYTSYILNVQHDGTLEVSSGPHLNRYFPVVFATEQSCQSVTKRCSEAWTSYLDTNKTQLPMLHSEQVAKVKLLEIEGTVYMIVASDGKQTDLGNLVVYQRDPYSKIWSILQNLENNGTVEFDLLQTEGGKETLLAVANLIKNKNSGVAIFQWDRLSEQFTILKIIAGFPSCVKWVDNGLDYYLVIANEASANVDKCNNYVEPINVYMYGKKDLIWIHSTDIRGVTSMLPFRLGGETFLLAASYHFNQINLLQLKGYSGFSLLQIIPAPGVEDMHTFWVSEELYVAVASRSGHTRVLKAAVRGSAPKRLNNHFITTHLLNSTNGNEL